MAKGRGPKKPKKPKGITPDFEDLLNTSDSLALKTLIVTIQKQLEEVNEFMKGEQDSEASQELARLKGQLAVLEGPSRDTKTILVNRTKALLRVLTERGHL